jgi:colanic acid/amylovoran biosynthesis glycosyltransferase
MIEKNIALISPTENASSETFIKQHRLNLKGNVIYYFNGYIPKENDIENRFLKKKDKYTFFIKNKLKLTSFSINEQALIKSFKQQKINIVVAEYGITAVHVLDVCKHLNIPLIPIFHGFDASIKSILTEYEQRYKHVFEYVKRIISVSNKIKETIIELGCDSSKIVVSPCAPDDSFLDLSPSFKSQTFFGIGRFVDKKAPYYSILAFREVLKEFPNAKLILAGDGVLLNMCENLVAFFGITNNVKLIGRVSIDEVQACMLKSIAFVQHSIIAKNGDSEGTPVAILEASAAGLPIVSTYHAGIKNVVINGETGFLVNEHEVNEMADKMILILRNIKEAKIMGDKGRIFISTNFSKKIHIEKINQAIKDVLDE